MATKVSYKQGTKATYLGLTTRYSNALYFCTDTKELFKGDDLYTDGLRFVQNYDALPEFSKAADGVIYYAMEEGASYVLLPARNGWLRLSKEYDGITIGANENGFIEVKAIPIGKVTGLEERLESIEKAAVGGVHYRGSVPTVDDLPTDAKEGDLYEVEADNSEWCYNGTKWFEYGHTTDLSPVAKATLDSGEFVIDEDNVLHIAEIEAKKISYRGEALLDVLDSIQNAISWEEMGVNLSPNDGSIAAEVAALSDGDTASIAEGVIAEAITVDKSVSLRGANAGLAQNFKQEV